MGRVSSIKIERCVVVINAAARVGKVQPGKGLGGKEAVRATWVLVGDILVREWPQE